MDKEFTGLEIMNMIAKDEIKEGEKFRIGLDESYSFYNMIFIFDGEDFTIENNGRGEYLTDLYAIKGILDLKFKRISDKIDIQAIEELNKQDSETMNEETITEKINELIKAVKYLDKKEG